MILRYMRGKPLISSEPVTLVNHSSSTSLCSPRHIPARSGGHTTARAASSRLSCGTTTTRWRPWTAGWGTSWRRSRDVLPSDHLWEAALFFLMTILIHAQTLSLGSTPRSPATTTTLCSSSCRTTGGGRCRAGTGGAAPTIRSVAPRGPCTRGGPRCRASYTAPSWGQPRAPGTDYRSVHKPSRSFTLPGLGPSPC